MSIGRRALVVATLFAAAVAVAMHVGADDHPPLLERARAAWVTTPRHFMTAAPGVGFYPSYVAGPYPPSGPTGGVPAFNWGYFGARFQPNRYTHVGYYRDVTNWMLPRGF